MVSLGHPPPTNVSGGWKNREMEAAHWSIEVHEDFNFDRFLCSLSAPQALEVAEAVDGILPQLGNRLAGSHWVKALGEGLFEFRISGPNLLVRVFFTYKRGRVVLLLAAYDKGRDSSTKRQQREINKAKKRMKNA